MDQRFTADACRELSTLLTAIKANAQVPAGARDADERHIASEGL